MIVLPAILVLIVYATVPSLHPTSFVSLLLIMYVVFAAQMELDCSIV